MTLLCKSGLAHQLLPYVRPAESYGRAALASYVSIGSSHLQTGLVYEMALYE